MAMPPKPPPAPAKGLQTSRPAVRGEALVLYGTGGIGKTSLAALAPAPVVFDLDNGLSALGVDVPAAEGVDDWAGLVATLEGPGFDAFRTVVIDTATVAEEWASKHTVETVPSDKGNRVKRIEDYGFGKGYTHLFDTFLGLLHVLDKHRRAGRNVVLVAHDCWATVPNPQGDDYVRYEPRLYTAASGKNSIRCRVKEWADHVCFVGYDIDVKNGKGQGSGTRTIWVNEFPHCLAKSRRLRDSIFYEEGSTELWTQLGWK
jgi:hypothetical protein